VQLVVRVVSVDDASLSKAAMVLTLANTMAKQDLGQMLVGGLGGGGERCRLWSIATCTGSRSLWFV
jgi:hypothetical protein